MQLSPILLFVYNRLWHAKQTIKALQQNELSRDSELYIYSDGPKNRKDTIVVDRVRSYLKQIDGFKTVRIIKRYKNWGLAKSVIAGISDIVSQYDKVIVLEDDLLLSPHFLRFMNEGLEFYRDDERVISLHGYIYPLEGQLPETFFLRGADCWGWATWRRGWDEFEEDGKKLLDELEQSELARKFDFDGNYPYFQMLRNQIQGKNDSWAIRWYASAFVKNKLTLYPGKSLVKNIGLDGSGRHCAMNDAFHGQICNKFIPIKKIPVEEHALARKQIIKYFQSNKKGNIRRGFNKLLVYFSKAKKLSF